MIALKKNLNKMGIINIIRKHLETLEKKDKLFRGEEKAFVYLPEPCNGIGAEVYFLIAPKEREMSYHECLNSFLREVISSEFMTEEILPHNQTFLEFDPYNREGDRLHIGAADLITDMGYLGYRFNSEEKDYRELVFNKVKSFRIPELPNTVFINEKSQQLELVVTVKAYPNEEVMKDNLDYIRCMGRRRKVGRDMINLSKYRLVSNTEG